MLFKPKFVTDEAQPSVSVRPLFEYFLEFVYDSLFNDGLSAPAHRMWTDFNPVCVTST